MRVSLDLCPISKLNNKPKAKNAEPKSDVTFRGARDDSTPYFAYSIDISQIFKSSAYRFKTKLQNEGFTRGDLRRWDIFSHQEPQNDLAFQELFKGYDYFHKKSRIVSHTPDQMKDPMDVAAMERVYYSLKRGLVTRDVEKYNEIFSEIGEVIETNLGVKMAKDRPSKNLALQILSYTNKHNEGIVEELLDDRNFNNAHIAQAIMKMQTPEHAELAYEVLSRARKLGYDKEFSLPLAIMLNEVTETNLPVIKKALREQDYLVQNREFVSERFIDFLRQSDYLTVSYMKDKAMTLKEVDDIMVSLSGL